MWYYFVALLSLYSTYYTIRLSLKIFKDKNLPGGIGTLILAISPLVISVIRIFFH